METIQLTGEAITGLSATPRQQAFVEQLPVSVCLGRRAPKSRPQAMPLAKYIAAWPAASIPTAVDWYTKAAESIARMYLNDRYGDCVFAGKAHALGIWSANDPDSTPDGRVVLATDQEISDQYFAYTGGRDNGAVITEVLDLMRSKGFLAGGKRYTIDGYVSCDWRSKELTQIGLAIFGAGSIGINLPSAWTSSAVWDVTNTSIVGGHDVTPCGYGAKVLGTNADGVVISSWGRLYLITWPAWTSSRWLDELYFMLPTYLWTGADKKAPSGVDYAGLKSDLAMLGGGNLPPLPDPNPPVPPVPPPVPPPPSPPPLPPLPAVLHGVGQTQPYSFTVPVGLFGQKTITIPGQTIQVSVPTTAQAAAGAIPWAAILAILAQYGAKVLPIVLADIAAGKTLQQILADVIASLMK